jgi:hypothetical protein
VKSVRTRSEQFSLGNVGMGLSMSASRTDTLMPPTERMAGASHE